MWGHFWQADESLPAEHCSVFLAQSTLQVCVIELSLGFYCVQEDSGALLRVFNSVKTSCAC